MTKEMAAAVKAYTDTHPDTGDFDDKERAKAAQDALLANNAWEFLSAEGEPVDKAKLENALKSTEPQQFFIREKGGDQGVYAMTMVPSKKDTPAHFHVDTKPLTPERLEEHYLPARITKPAPLSRWQRFVSSARSFFRMKPSTAQKNHDQAMKTYQDNLSQFRWKVGVPTFEDRSRNGIGIDGLTPNEARPRNVSQENLKKEMHVLDRFLRPQNLGYEVTAEQGREICSAEGAFTPDWRPGNVHNYWLSEDWKAYSSFATAIHNAAEKDPGVRNLVCSMGALRDRHQEAIPDRGLFSLFSTYRTQYNNGKILDVEAMLSDAVHGKTRDRKTHDLTRLLKDGRAPQDRIKEKAPKDPIKAPEPQQPGMH